MEAKDIGPHFKNCFPESNFISGMIKRLVEYLEQTDYESTNHTRAWLLFKVATF